MKILFFLTRKYKNAPEAKGAGVRAEKETQTNWNLSNDYTDPKCCFFQNSIGQFQQSIPKVALCC